MRLILNIIWLIFGGLWLALGYVLAALICFVLIITIPFGFASLRIAVITPTAPESRRAANATAAALEWSSHCRSSMPINTGLTSASVSMTDRNAAATARGSVGVSPGSPRSKTRSSAKRCGSGRLSSTVVSTRLRRSASAT